MINGSQLRDAYISAANHIVARRQEVDALNVFPVPDGDTGTNMSMTISAAVPELKLMENPTVAAVAKTAASALLRGARGQDAGRGRLPGTQRDTRPLVCRPLNAGGWHAGCN